MIKTLPRAEVMYRGGAAQRWQRLCGKGSSAGSGVAAGGGDLDIFVAASALTAGAAEGGGERPGVLA